jgi:YbbR domain-containing protein
MGVPVLLAGMRTREVKAMLRLGPVLETVKSIFLDNIALKVLSLAFALLLYAFIHSSQDAQRTMAVDLVAQTPPPSAHRLLLSPLPPGVRVTIRGSQSMLDQLRAEDLGSLQLDLKSGKVDHVDLEPSMVRVPAGLRAEQIDPSRLDLRWEDEIARQVVVQASIVGQPAPGFVVKGAPKADPPVIVVRGPQSAVETMQYARVEPFDVTGLAREGDYERTLPIERPQSRVELESPTAQVKVEIAREELQRVFTKVPVQIVGAARGTVTPPDVDVRVEGPPEIVKALRADQVVPTVDVRSGAGAPPVQPPARLPVSAEIERCRVTLQPKVVVVRWQP